MKNISSVHLLYETEGQMEDRKKELIRKNFINGLRFNSIPPLTKGENRWGFSVVIKRENSGSLSLRFF